MSSIPTLTLGNSSNLTPRKPGHSVAEEEEIVMSTLRRLLAAIDTGDYATYCELSDTEMTAFEPEGHGALIEGLTFHKFYFDNYLNTAGPGNSTICSPRFQLLSDIHALVTKTGANGQWICLHFHRSAYN
ncbi:Calcium/calmodulin dependent protein kinase II association-domain-containing protein [Pavlovales sp. CCMP2436]|nr:Calcium/calmodulin dependent protein kinase II association-domain-containing protein [Pavlovales sp. CCMP2436]